MTPTRTIFDWLRDIVLWREKLERFIAGMSREQFLGDEKTQAAASECAEAIGEASNQLMMMDPTLDAAYPELQLRNAYKSRNRLSHGYYGVDLGSLWKTVSESVPATVAAARKVIVEHEAGEGARGGTRGFALIEMLCVLAIIGLLAAIILPAIPRATSRAKLESYAVETAALLKADRTAALRRQVQVATQIDAEARSIRSGVTGRVIRFPADVSLDAYLASRCADRNAGRSIDFFPSGMSCGGTIALARPGMGYEVRVNWLTGGVEIVPKKLL